MNLQSVRIFGSATPAETSEPTFLLEDASSFERVYEACVAFVFRTARRLGVPEESVDDVVQEVFVVVHRRLADYDGRGPLKSWVYGILARIAANHRRTTRRRETFVALTADGAPEAVAPTEEGPARLAERQEAARWVLRILDMLDDQKREVLILSELEHMSLSEIASAVGSNVNTVYSRLKAAKKAFLALHVREQARAASWRGR